MSRHYCHTAQLQYPFQLQLQLQLQLCHCATRMMVVALLVTSFHVLVLHLGRPTTAKHPHGMCSCRHRDTQFAATHGVTATEALPTTSATHIASPLYVATTSCPSRLNARPVTSNERRRGQRVIEPPASGSGGSRAGRASPGGAKYCSGDACGDSVPSVSMRLVVLEPSATTTAAR